MRPLLRLGEARGEERGLLTEGSPGIIEGRGLAKEEGGEKREVEAEVTRPSRSRKSLL